MEERRKEKTPVHSCTYTSVSDLLREPVNALPSPLILPVMYKNPSYNKFKVENDTLCKGKHSGDWHPIINSESKPINSLACRELCMHTYAYIFDTNAGMVNACMREGLGIPYLYFKYSMTILR